ncbi:egg cell-secreted protein [Salix suchowensis]|nr:egg cell-secreted protein [Salix suchowensis]
MASCLKLFLFAAVLACISLDGAKARPLAASISNLSARLKLDEESPNCWDSLFQLQACTGEIVLFFLDGETRLGHSCCQALSTVGEHCWPNMIGTLGLLLKRAKFLKATVTKLPIPLLHHCQHHL